jgi:hypothetical protein
MTHKLYFKAPRRQSVAHPQADGSITFSTKMWDTEGVKLARTAGAWFSHAGDHDFDSDSTSAAARIEEQPA